MIEATSLDMNHLQKPASSSCGPIFPSASPPRGGWRDGFCDWHKKCVPSCKYKYIIHLVYSSKNGFDMIYKRRLYLVLFQA
jgi:hypothetical protein